MRKMAPLFVAALILGLILSSANAGNLTPVDVSEFYVTPDRAATLHWQAVETPTLGQLAYTLFDVNATKVSSGTARIDGKSVVAEVTLPQGYFEIAFDAAGERFGIVSQAAAEERIDEFFAIDAALSWLVKGDDLREGIIKSAKRSGIGMMRERFRLNGVAPEEGKYDWETQNRYDTLRETYKRHGVEVLELSHNAADWMGKRKVYPKNLAQYANAWSEIAKRWEPSWGAVEVWNEPDIFFGGDLPADQYVALIKTLAYRFGRDGVKKPLVGGVVAHFNEDWLNTARANQMLELIDVFSFHTYDRAPAMESLIEKYRGYCGALPLWLTECGRPWKKGPDRPPVEQDLESVTDIVMKGVESKCCGVARYFPFVLPYYEENDNNFGMLDRQGTPLRSMAGYAQMIRVLSHANYVGDLNPKAWSVTDELMPPVQRARVFLTASAESVIVLYTGDMRPTELKTTFDLKKAESVTGETLPVDSLVITNGLIYLYANAPGNLIDKDTTAMKLRQASRQPREDFKYRPSPLVPVYDYDEDVVTPTSAGYRVKSELFEKVKTTIYNISDREVGGEMAMPGGSTMIHDIGLEPGHSETVEELCGMYDADSDRPSVHYDLSCRGEIDPVTYEEVADSWAHRWCFIVRFLMEPTWDGLLNEHKTNQTLEISPEKWTPSSSGKLEINAAEEGGVVFQCAFGNVDRWCYPRLRLPDDLTLRKGGGIIARIRCTGETTPRVFLFEEPSGAGYLSNDGKMFCPADGQWHAIHVPFDAFSHNGSTPPDPNGKLDLDQVKTLSFGFNTKSETATFEVGSVYVY